ncbi:hypothetical protein SAY87_031630 [Trapa incisa]|uniref:Uncharacterized protein n=1 Tax=Trapa incisa TaxID=236973 RepID=A0AAN7KVD9_9MYRT|nr:hypothetical protein SAY87_031630 [Trapa incisa]
MKTDRVLKISLLMFMVLFFFFHLFPLIYLFDVDFTSSLYDRWNLSSTRNDGALLRHRVLADPKKQRSLGAMLLSLAVDRKTDETVGILFPGWEVFVVADPLFAGPGEGLHCVFPNNATSPARFAGVLPSSDRATFICTLPRSARRHPYYQPMLTMCFRSPYPVVPHRQSPELLRWNYLAYDSLSTEDDVVLFVKGVNRWRRISLPPSELNCVFYDGDDPAVGVRTAVTSSVQEVFRCGHPLLAKGGNGQEEHVNIKITLEIPLEKRFVPSVAYYAPYRAHQNL